MTKKMISLDELSRYDTNIKNEISKDTYELYLDLDDLPEGMSFDGTTYYQLDVDDYSDLVDSLKTIRQSILSNKYPKVYVYFKKSEEDWQQNLQYYYDKLTANINVSNFSASNSRITLALKNDYNYSPMAGSIMSTFIVNKSTLEFQFDPTDGGEIDPSLTLVVVDNPYRILNYPMYFEKPSDIYTEWFQRDVSELQSDEAYLFDIISRCSSTGIKDSEDMDIMLGWNFRKIYLDSNRTTYIEPGVSGTRFKISALGRLILLIPNNSDYQTIMMNHFDKIVALHLVYSGQESDLDNIRPTEFYTDTYFSSVSWTIETIPFNKNTTTDNLLIPYKGVSNSKVYELAGLSEYSASSTYAVGDYVYYNELIYKCNTAISVAEVWTAAHWTRKTYLEYMRDALNIPSTGVSDSTNSDIDDLFNEEEEVSE